MRFRLHFTVAALFVFVGCAYSAPSDFFDPLFRITSVKGDVTLVRPGGDTPEKAREAHAYPYGSRLLVPKWDPESKTPQPEVSFSLSRDHRFRLSSLADLTVGDPSADDPMKKVFTLKSGSLKTFISISTVKTGGAEDERVEAGIQALLIETPLAVCSRLTERNEIKVSSEVKTHTVMVATESGTMEIEGPQFKIHSMRRNAAVEIFGDTDYTRILDLASDFTVELEKGIDGVEKVLFRPRCVAKIWRSFAEIGGKMAVSVMVAFPDGVINSYAYLEGENVVLDSAYASATGASEVGGGDERLEGEADVVSDALPAETNTVPAVETDSEVGVVDELDAGGFNFDDW